MTELRALINRNTRLFFKDKGMFLTALITPMILLVLYATFLGNIYRDSFLSAIPEGITLPDKLIGGCVGGQLVGSLLSVSCVTVSFCSNLLMVQDKVSGARRDLTVSPVKSSTLALGYYLATILSSLLICLVALAVCMVYLASVGWYLSAADVLLLTLDVVLLVLFGTALSSIINFFLSSQGQISAVGTIISSCYGFISGAYMPISQFSTGLQKALSFLPGTYGTALVRTHAMRGCFDEMISHGLEAEYVQAMGDSIDCSIFFFGKRVGEGMSYLILSGTVVLCIVVYILMNTRKRRREP